MGQRNTRPNPHDETATFELNVFWEATDRKRWRDEARRFALGHGRGPKGTSLKRADALTQARAAPARSGPSGVCVCEWCVGGCGVPGARLIDDRVRDALALLIQINALSDLGDS
jgi:hypothetical protein